MDLDDETQRKVTQAVRHALQPLTIYSATKDEHIPVTQEIVDGLIQKANAYDALAMNFTRVTALLAEGNMKIGSEIRR